jgi:hypothetical protein
MKDLTPSQIGLLNLAKETPDPTVEERYAFGPSYGVSRTTLRRDLFVLLERFLIEPTSLDWETFFLSVCRLTKSGEEYLSKAQKLNLVPDSNTREQLDALFDELSNSQKWFNPLDTWPRFEQIPLVEVITLADTYFYCAQDSQINNTFNESARLYYFAARGYAKLSDKERFSKSFKEVFNVMRQERNYREIAAEISRAFEVFNGYENIIFEAAVTSLAESYWLLTGKRIPKFSNKETLEECISEIFQEAHVIGADYKIGIPERNSLSRIAISNEGILFEAFRGKNSSLYNMVIDIEYSILETISSMVTISDSAKAFESRVGYKNCANMAFSALLTLERLNRLTQLDEEKRKKAWEILRAMFHIFYRYVAFPPMNRLSEPHIDIEAHWTFVLLESPKYKMGKELTHIFDQLFDLLHSKKETEERDTVEKEIIKPTIQTLKEQIDQLTEISKETNFKVGKIDRFVSDILQLMVSADTNNRLQTLSEILLHNALLLEEIDSKFESMVPNLHEDIKKWITMIQQDNQISSDQRQTMIRKLDEILEIKSTGKIIASVPLIPGFLKYEHHTEIQMDWKKWIKKIKAAL